MKKQTLTRNEANRLRTKQSDLAEELAADAYGYSTTGSNPFDAIRESGAVAEVKSTVSRHQNGNRGRFRLWEKQHERLTRKDRKGSAMYIFILFDVSVNPPVAKMKQENPAKVGNIVSGRGGFNESNHPAGPQHKLPWAVFF